MMDKRKVDRAIAFIEGNRCMMESLKSQEDDQDIVSYILKILKQHHKKETPGAATPRASKVTCKNISPLL